VSGAKSTINITVYTKDGVAEFLGVEGYRWLDSFFSVEISPTHRRLINIDHIQEVEVFTEHREWERFFPAKIEPEDAEQ
jgi:hypothetical protein